MFSLLNCRESSELTFEFINENTENCAIFKNNINHSFIIKVNKLNPFIDLASKYSITKLFNNDFHDTFISELLNKITTLNNSKIDNDCDKLKDYIKNFEMPEECKNNGCFMSKENLHIVFVFEDTQDDNIFKVFIPLTTLSKAKKYENNMKEIVTDFFQYYFKVKPYVKFEYGNDVKKIISNSINKV